MIFTVEALLSGVTRESFRGDDGPMGSEYGSRRTAELGKVFGFASAPPSKRLNFLGVSLVPGGRSVVELLVGEEAPLPALTWRPSAALGSAGH